MSNLVNGINNVNKKEGSGKKIHIFGSGFPSNLQWDGHLEKYYSKLLIKFILSVKIRVF